MANYDILLIEDWWKHCGCWDRDQASGIPYEDYDGDQALYLDITDDWWNSLTNDEKAEVCDEFFNENE